MKFSARDLIVTKQITISYFKKPLRLVTIDSLLFQFPGADPGFDQGGGLRL